MQFRRRGKKGSSTILVRMQCDFSYTKFLFKSHVVSTSYKCEPRHISLPSLPGSPTSLLS